MATRRKAALRTVPVRSRRGIPGRRLKRRGPRTLLAFKRVGPRVNVVQVVPPRHVYRPRVLSAEEAKDHELAINPLKSPTGPGGAPGFHNVNNSQIAMPNVLNVYMGPFWNGDSNLFEGSCKAVVENGYLDPLRELNYGTGSGTYLGSVQGEALMPAPTCEGCGGGQIGDYMAIYAHELAEACTDKVPGQGWVADDGQENGDLEAWILFGWGPASDPNRYTVQGYYTNERGNTLGAWRGPLSS